MQTGFDVFLLKLRIVLSYDDFWSETRLEELKNKISHDTSPFYAGLTVANIWIDMNTFDQIIHSYFALL